MYIHISRLRSSGRVMVIVGSFLTMLSVSEVEDGSWEDRLRHELNKWREENEG